MNAFTRVSPTPNDLFEAARHNATLDHCLQAWRAGHWTLEKALTIACVHLARQNAELLENAVMTEMLRERQAPACKV